MRFHRPLYRNSFLLAMLMLGWLMTGGAQPGESKLPPGLVWVSRSVEYAAICQQTYRSAWQAVKRAAAREHSDWAVVLDVDETVLNNAQYEIELAQKGERYTPKSWAAWVRRQQATPVPGVRAFLDSVRSLGPQAHVVFITNRDAALEAPTIANLRVFGLWRQGDVLLARRDRADTKLIRRREVKTGTGRCAGLGPRHILALFGDQLADLMEVNFVAAPDSMRRHYLHRPGWARRYFMLPNPMYGAWQRGYH